MSLRPKIVKLIDRYNQKKGTLISCPHLYLIEDDPAELVSMNDTFIKAKTIFDRMMEESLARHSGKFIPVPSNSTVSNPFIQVLFTTLAMGQGHILFGM
jgi:signal transducing adaptor molecule